jgi:hypothetical protein
LTTPKTVDMKAPVNKGTQMLPDRRPPRPADARRTAYLG